MFARNLARHPNADRAPSTSGRSMREMFARAADNARGRTWRGTSPRWRRDPTRVQRPSSRARAQVIRRNGTQRDATRRERGSDATQVETRQRRAVAFVAQGGTRQDATRRDATRAHPALIHPHTLPIRREACSLLMPSKMLCRTISWVYNRDNIYL